MTQYSNYDGVTGEPASGSGTAFHEDGSSGISTAGIHGHVPLPFIRCSDGCVTAEHTYNMQTTFPVVQ